MADDAEKEIEIDSPEAGMGGAVSVIFDEPDLDIVDEFGGRARTGATRVAASATQARSSLEKLLARIFGWLVGTAAGVWVRKLWCDWLALVPVDARDVRREDLLAILRGLRDGATSFPALEASLARYALKCPETSDQIHPHGLVYRRSQFCNFRTSTRLRYAWYLLGQLGIVSTFGHPDFEAELTSMRLQRVAGDLIALEKRGWGQIGSALASVGRQMLIWETSLAKSRSAARISLAGRGLGSSILADPDFWFHGNRLPITTAQMSRLWETWIFFAGTVGGFLWSIAFVFAAHDLPRHLRPSMFLFSLCCVACAILLAVCIAPTFGSFASELMWLKFRRLPTLEGVRAQYHRREVQREKRRNTANERIWEFSREAEIARLSRDAPVTIRTDRLDEVISAIPDAQRLDPPASAAFVPGVAAVGTANVAVAESAAPTKAVESDGEQSQPVHPGAGEPAL